MSVDPDLIRFIREEVRREANVILSGSAGSNTVDKEDVDEMFPGMSTVTQRPVAHPYGFASRAKRGTIQVVGRQGEHTGNRIVIGHRDKDRPTDLVEGESAVYSKENMQMRASNEKITMGKSSDGSDGGFAGNSFIAVSEEAGTVTIQHKQGHAIQLLSDGSIALVAKDGGYLFMNSETNEVSVVSKDGNIVSLKPDGITIADKTGKQIIDFDGEGKVQITADAKVVVSAPETSIVGGTVNLGSTALFSNTIAEALEVYLDTHTHFVTAVGSPTSPPIILSSVYNLVPAVSFKALFVKQRSNIV